MNEYATADEIRALIARLRKASVYDKKSLLASLRDALGYAEMGIKVSKAVGSAFSKASNAVLIGSVDQESDSMVEDE
jgi:hypothetical protein